MSPANALTGIYTSVDLLTRLAKSYRWVREVGGENRGEAVRHILRVTGLDQDNPWCAAFVAMVGRDAFGDDWPLPLVAGCATLGEAARAKGLLYNYPAPGAVFLLWSERLGRYHHTGIVERPTEHGWATIEGNAAEQDDSPHGIGVFEKERDFMAADRFIYWWAPVSHA